MIDTSSCPDQEQDHTWNIPETDLVYWETMLVIIVSAWSDYTIGFLCAGTELIESVSGARLPH